MLISHEVPVSLFKESQLFNDYEYCLLHLLLSNERYKNFYVKQSVIGRRCILDNSLFELGDSLSIDKLIEGIKLIKPSEYIVPDCLNDCNETISRFNNFTNNYKSDIESISPNSKNIGVVQGSTLTELINCYKYMSLNADKIAIPFDSKGFSDLFTEKELKSISNLDMWCCGRQRFIKYLYENNIFNNSKPHHLLGCSLAKEFSYELYKELHVESVDTSNPVVAGMNKVCYGEDGLNYKISTKLCDLIDHNVSTFEKDVILLNVYKFRCICNGKNWVCFFSQTGSEIANISRELNIAPSLIVTNKDDMSNIHSYLLNNYRDRIIKIPNKPVYNDYIRVTKRYWYCFIKSLLTLNGYLRIIPAHLCEQYEIYNLHPGLITKYPELKGFNPQEKAYNLKLPVGGCVIHKVTPLLDSGEIVAVNNISIRDLTLEEIYSNLHDLASKMWIKWLRKCMN